MHIKHEKSAPSYASESDCERGAEEYRAIVTERGAEPVLIRAADILRGDGDIPEWLAPSLRTLEAAEHAAECAVKSRWQDQTADSGVSFWIDCAGVDVPAHVAHLMDDDIREQIETDDGATFVVEYIAKHMQKHGEEWTFN